MRIKSRCEIPIQSNLMMIYGLGLPALLIFNIAVFSLILQYKSLPLPMTGGISTPVALVLLLGALAILLITMKKNGLFAPLIAENRRVRQIGLTALVAGFSVLVFGLSSISVSLDYFAPEILHSGFLNIYLMLETGTVLVSAIITLLGFRMAYFYSEANTFARRQTEMYNKKILAEARLNHQLNFIRALTNCLGEGVLALDLAGKITFINPTALRLLGCDLQDAEGKPAEHLFSSERIHHEWLATVQNTLMFEDVFTKKDLQKFPVLCTVAPILIEGETTGRIITFRDVTERKNAEWELELYATRLERSNRDLEQFAYLASHDLQAPLIKLRKFADILKTMELPPEDKRDIVNRIQNCAHRMQGMILDILTLARISTSKKTFERVDLSEVLADVMPDLEDPIQRSGAQIEIGAMDTLEGDPVQLRQLIYNLLDNALKFHKAGVPPEIKISTERLDNQTCQIIVSDKGIGFKNEYNERIFNMFERLNGVSDYPGSGIGLAVCQKTVERHHGTITARGIPGEGAVFTATLPLRQPTPQDFTPTQVFVTPA